MWSVLGLQCPSRPVSRYWWVAASEDRWTCDGLGLRHWSMGADCCCGCMWRRAAHVGSRVPVGCCPWRLQLRCLWLSSPGMPQLVWQCLKPRRRVSMWKFMPFLSPYFMGTQACRHEARSLCTHVVPALTHNDDNVCWTRLQQLASCFRSLGVMRRMLFATAVPEGSDAFEFNSSSHNFFQNFS